MDDNQNNSGNGEAMIATPDGWTEAHELAALERLFEIGLAVLRSGGLDRAHESRNLASCTTSTRKEFESSLRRVVGYEPGRIAVEVSVICHVVAEKSR